ncbi:MAG TPA: hypothetical protein VND15_01580 [Candidatus Acidoferrales bacterium]|nr:hypothetical protein [Candidatus Acidoferrales bacterium]
MFSWRKPKVDNPVQKDVQSEHPEHHATAFERANDQRKELYSGASVLYASMKDFKELKDSEMFPSIIEEARNAKKILQALPALVRSRSTELPDLMDAIGPAAQMDLTYLKFAGFPRESIDTVVYFFNGFMEQGQNAKSSAINTGKMIVGGTFDFADEKLKKDIYAYIFGGVFRSHIKEVEVLGEKPTQRGYSGKLRDLRQEWEISRDIMDALCAAEKSMAVKSALASTYNEYNNKLDEVTRVIETFRNSLENGVR